MNFERMVLQYRWDQLYRDGIHKNLSVLADDRYLFQGCERQRTPLRVNHMDAFATINILPAARFGFVLSYLSDRKALELRGFILPNPHRPEVRHLRPLSGAYIEFTEHSYYTLLETMYQPAYADEFDSYSHPHEHLAQLVIDKTLGVNRHEPTPDIGTERAANGVIRWSGVLEDGDQGGHCNQLSVAGHQPRIGR